MVGVIALNIKTLGDVVRRGTRETRLGKGNTNLKATSDCPIESIPVLRSDAFRRG